MENQKIIKQDIYKLRKAEKKYYNSLSPKEKIFYNELNREEKDWFLEAGITPIGEELRSKLEIAIKKIEENTELIMNINKKLRIFYPLLLYTSKKLIKKDKK